MCLVHNDAPLIGMQWADKPSEDCGRKSKAPDQNGRALFVMYFPLSDMVFVDCSVLVVFDQIYRVHLLVKNAGMNKFQDIAVEDKFHTGSAGGTELSWDRHQHRFFLGAFELSGKIHRRKMGEEGCNVSQFYHPFSVFARAVLSAKQAEPAPCSLVLSEKVPKLFRVIAFS